METNREHAQNEGTHDLAKWLAGEMTAEELAAFQRSQDYEDYRRIAQFSSQLQTEAFDADAVLASVMRPRQRVRRVRFMDRLPVLVAAAILVLAGLFFLLRPQTITSVETANAEIRELWLPDGSEIRLNSGSHIQYVRASWPQKRELTLDGEAYFKVAKGKTFDVRTSLGTVTVVGTRFNVSIRGGRFETECFEGVVRVSQNGEVVMLHKGEIVTFENGSRMESSASFAETPAWMRGELRFSSASLDEVARELERRFNVRIDVKAATKKTVSGSFPARELQPTLKILAQLYAISITTNAENVLIFADE